MSARPDRQPLAVLIRDTDGKVTGGLSGFTAWGWLFTQMLYIPDTLRGTGMAGNILAKAEEEAKARGCRGAWIDTFNPQALRAYLRQGYEVFGELEDFPEGRTRSFLRKILRSPLCVRKDAGALNHSRQAIVPFSRACTPSAIGTTSTRPGSTGPEKSARYRRPSRSRAGRNRAGRRRG